MINFEVKKAGNSYGEYESIKIARNIMEKTPGSYIQYQGVKGKTLEEIHAEMDDKN